MKLVVYGMMRSGTTLMCDLLSAPNRSLVFAEPMMLDSWSDQRAAEIHAAAKEFGLPVPAEPPEEGRFATMADYFERVLEPHLNDLDFWGFKEVYFHNWPDVLDRYRPDKLVLCVRDIRDITISALDLIINSKLAFPGGKRMRDEAWLLARLCYDVRQLLRLRARPHHLVRYEDLASQPDVRARLAEFAGLERLSAQTVHRSITFGGERKGEMEKHGQGVSSRSMARAERDTRVQAIALANHIARLLPRYSATFGYAATAARPKDKKPPGNRITPPSWNEVEDWRSTGPWQFDPAFARRRARSAAVQNIRSNTAVVELGCLIPVLRHQLPKGCRYLGLGDQTRPPDMLAADWRRGEFPDLAGVDLLAVIGSLEFVDDVDSFVAVLAATGKPILLTYHATDDTRGLERGRFGWRNDLSRRDLVAVFERNGFRIRHLWAFDGYQSLFRLRPGDDQAA